MTRRATSAIAIAAIAVLAGCGSRVPLDRAQQELAGGGALSVPSTSATSGDANPSGSTGSSHQAGGTGENGSGSGTGIGPGTSNNSGGGVGSGRSSGGGGVRRTTSTTSAPTTGQSGTGQPTPSTSTSSGSNNHDPVTVGIPYVASGASNGFTSSIGAGLASADTYVEASAYIKAINKAGGVAGHQIQPVFFQINSSDSQADYEQATCEDFTQDHHVEFALEAGMSYGYVHCALAGGVQGLVGSGDLNFTEAQLADLNGVVYPDAIALDRLVQAEATDFTNRGFFAKNAKVGILYEDLPQFAQAESDLAKDLAARNVKVVVAQGIHPVAAEADLAGTVSADQAAELHFRSLGVTNVLTVETNAFLSGFFAVGAASQHYYPHYGFTSDQPLTNVIDNVPAKELAGTIFMGWRPAEDLTNSSAFNSKAKACLHFMAHIGQPTSSGNERFDALGICEDLDYLKAALVAGTDNGTLAFTRANFLAGAADIDKTYVPEDTFGTSVGPSHYDGLAEVRDGIYGIGCGCFEYTSGPHSI